MQYSYIKPRSKTIFTKDMQLLFTFFGVTIFMLFSTYSFLIFRDYRFKQDLADISVQKEQLSSSILKMNQQIATIEKQNLMSEKIFTKNSVLKDSINNLFDLIPSRVTLSEAKIMEDGLILYGITPNKDVYNFMLQAPLRSIFHRTYSSFYPVENGWLRFVSTNYIDEEELKDEN
ncbi:MAG: hypothetical protein A2513_09860 [Sulfurimonas sp. RIFOXYD12_FULL_33_39]|uniref:hypothetical protein n=1 Tax=unclassified Sulfurimonas TaxID=2623549 RepID=UPI0008B5A5E4|nr:MULTISPECIES: hypothetical protein [unclassified Sulfurimonas]OHE04899.1 MAG: hypothetical protein A3G74_06490 [Sulfurimonas sp. RIFCSPLOWO2_12_FULL_34_6]OHE09620.1 MAG: hypothetical protein A2513_09860 [Sulfurimonas sp. RIFOXYD12_FULL_33_39]OHE13873.1 MAG: hypothetical protein A2530_09895 [Sulfurimonas sp. RIFOXYD2_FULL_34_21]DAB27652.1 MAG TPA: hypothetical protein CFH78_06460 [Sulfurimonas sp. UBA10385]